MAHGRPLFFVCVHVCVCVEMEMRWRCVCVGDMHTISVPIRIHPSHQKER